MTRKIPDDAFERYVALGAQRSFKGLADQLGVSKRAIAKCARREKWRERLEAIENNARARSDQKITETIEQMRDRHLLTLKAMHTRALSGLRDYPLTNGMDAMRAAEIAIKLERLIAGEPNEHGQMDLVEVTREEMRRLLKPLPAAVSQGDGVSPESSPTLEPEDGDDEY